MEGLTPETSLGGLGFFRRFFLDIADEGCRCLEQAAVIITAMATGRIDAYMCIQRQRSGTAGLRRPNQTRSAVQPLPAPIGSPSRRVSLSVGVNLKRQAGNGQQWQH